MNVHVNENCIGCGLCVNMCGSVFLMTEEGVAAARDEIFPEQEGQVQEWIGGSGAPTYQKRLEGCSGVMLRPGVSIGPHDPHHSGQQGGHSHDLIQHDNSTPFLFCYDFTPVLTVLSMDAPLILPPALPASIVHFSVFSSIQKELLFRSLSC